ncbi:hypothetical protein M1M94_00510, partial [Thermodesulfovibrionales bacterium]|nr:hypothetical protein [Thermodesulfovibrionales bacterium]
LEANTCRENELGHVLGIGARRGFGAIVAHDFFSSRVSIFFAGLLLVGSICCLYVNVGQTMMLFGFSPFRIPDDLTTFTSDVLPFLLPVVAINLSPIIIYFICVACFPRLASWDRRDLHAARPYDFLATMLLFALPPISAVVVGSLSFDKAQTLGMREMFSWALLLSPIIISGLIYSVLFFAITEEEEGFMMCITKEECTEWRKFFLLLSIFLVICALWLAYNAAQLFGHL